MIVWEKDSLDDREVIFEFLYEFNPLAAEKTDTIIETKVENLMQQPLMGVEREGIPGRLLIIPEVSMIVSYFVREDVIHILRVLHQKQKFPVGS
ncbi:MAG TPA: type II toxin-antitoxin system mRNA interferase toxin, RelE/StbE family [Alteromonas australica]|uniref:Type II toxin-antitoxin system mRNA interferase toxin, RelE/StbE family n=1 Tax=Alteromonas australica TaxID=589873 RepID=A0A350P0C2_9ALTE|nr:type II toxin-antitoxin system mRNA interferase toxin, RelE/StbE family [Alteromonas australica]HAW74739.1 type II toxin-antitoxin system mRNA interferase toxin, RelE/StbE family [Alteromonas australica]|tara:strand:- start:43 stop:324 length:282 start_codon:yes stop_codon:yes gene_type:complete